MRFPLWPKGPRVSLVLAAPLSAILRCRLALVIEISRYRKNLIVSDVFGAHSGGALPVSFVHSRGSRRAWRSIDGRRIGNCLVMPDLSSESQTRKGKGGESSRGGKCERRFSARGRHLRDGAPGGGRGRFPRDNVPPRWPEESFEALPDRSLTRS